MKKLMMIMAILISPTLWAQYYYNFPNTNWIYQRNICKATTVCPNGLRISCVVYGLNYSNIPSHLDQPCRTRVVPGQFIHCQGYAQGYDNWGSPGWFPTNIPQSCPLY